MVTALLFGSMIVFLAIGVPISFTLGAAVMATIFLAPDFTVSPGIIPQRILVAWNRRRLWPLLSLSWRAIL